MIDIINDESYNGFNITIPYKRSLKNILLSDVSRFTGSVNTVYRSKGNLYGDNTDVYGFIKAFEIANVDLYDIKSAVILGTGGVAQAIAYVLGKYGVKYKFVSRFKQGKDIISYQDFNYDNSELLINASPIGMPPNTNKLVSSADNLIKYSIIMDTAYSLNGTVLQMFAYSNSKIFVDGLVMLVAQAIQSQNIWFDSIYHNKENELINLIINYLKELK